MKGERNTKTTTTLQWNCSLHISSAFYKSMCDSAMYVGLYNACHFIL